MLYIISVLNYPKLGTTYMALDTCSDSVVGISSEFLKNIIQYTKTQVVNASIQNDNIVIKKWVNKLSTYTNTGRSNEHSGATHVLLATKPDSMYKIVDHHGTVSNVWRKDVRKLANYDTIANCNDRLEFEDTYEITSDAEFIASIAAKYAIFIAKSALLGIGDAGFRYDIENHEVRLLKYTGSSVNIILPSFITAIAQNAFYNANIRTIKLNEGLKVIGARAFVTKETTGLLERIEIPESVEMICNKAFVNNPRLVKSDGTLHSDRFIMRNKKTIVLDQSIYR